MKEELKAAYIEKEKAELLLTDLDKKSTDGSISKDQQESSRAEYSRMLDDANKSIKSIKSKLRKDFNGKADELESLKRELELLNGRLEIGEITAQSYRDQEKLLKRLIKHLEKETKDLGVLINSNCSADLGGKKTEDKRSLDKKNADKVKRIELSTGNMLVLGLIAAITIFVIVFAVINETKKDPPTTSGNGEDTVVILSSVEVSEITTSEALITWNTNKPTRSQLEFGTNSALGVVTSLSEELTLNHRIHLSGLEPDTTYFYRVRSVDADGNEAISAIYEILTLSAQADKLPFAINDINVINITDSSAAITWETDKEATGQVEYWVIPSDTILTPVNEELSAVHEVNLIGLSQSTTYYFRVKSVDASGNEVISDNSTTFVTLPSVPAGSIVGKEAPDFILLNLDGERIALKDFRGKWVMAIFWQAGCSSCRDELPHLQDYFQSRVSDEPVILAINVREKDAFIRTYAQSQGLTFPILLDQVALVTSYYKVKRFPTIFIIDPEGIIKKEIWQVFRTPEEIEETVNSVLGSAR